MHLLSHCQPALQLCIFKNRHGCSDACTISNRTLYFSTGEKALSTITKHIPSLSACFSLQHHPEHFSLVIIIASASLKAYGLQEERQPHFLYVDVFEVNVEEAEILQVETEDRKKMECVA